MCHSEVPAGQVTPDVAREEVRVPLPGGGTLPALLTRAATETLEGIVQLVSYRGGYIGACNVEDGAATICWLLDEPAMRELGPDWRVQLDHIARTSSAIGDLLHRRRHLAGARLRDRGGPRAPGGAQRA